MRKARDADVYWSTLGIAERSASGSATYTAWTSTAETELTSSSSANLASSSRLRTSASMSEAAVLVAGVVGGMGKLVGVAHLEGHVVIDLVDELLKLSGVDAVGAHGRTSFRKVPILHPLQGTVYDRRGAQSMRM